MAKRLARKNLVKIRKMSRGVEAALKDHRDWVEARCDEKGCYSDEWVRRAGYIRRGTEFTPSGIYIGTREKVEEELTKEVRSREDVLQEKQEAVQAFLETLAEKHEIYVADIDLKTGEIKSNGADILDELKEEEQEGPPGPEGKTEPCEKPQP